MDAVREYKVFNVAEAHHEDYDKPLDVMWLCMMHHRIYHDNPELLEV